MTLYAKWTPISVTAKFDVEGGQTLPQSTKTVTYDQPYGELPKPVLPGFRFLGWWTESGGKGELVTAETIMNTVENHTLYAYWKPLIELKKVNQHSNRPDSDRKRRP